MKRLLFIGAPGVGKGTYGSRVAEALGLQHISSGDLLRAEVARGAASPVGQAIKEKIDKGMFVPDALITDMILQHTANAPAGSKGYILDGFPRSLDQAKSVHAAKVLQIDHVFNLRQPMNVIIAKVSSRRSCADCGFGYNYAKIDEGGIKMDPLVPKVEGVCDKCGSTKPFVTRPDDAYETVKHRLELYEERTKPLEKFYADMGILSHFDVLGGPKKFLPQLLALIQQKV